jgi:hypothetical protein
MAARSFAVFATIASLAGSAHAQTAQLSAVHDALHLTAAQEAGWRAYVAAISPDPSADARHRETARMMPTLPTPRRVDLINAEVDEDAALVHRQGAAVKAFYASLTPAQQHAFDRQTAQTQAGGLESQQGGSFLGHPSTNSLPPPR